MAAVAAALLALAGAGAAARIAGDEPTRQQQIAERGERVMPFSLDATTHVFDGDSRGGVQRVVAKDASDAREIRLIREHLRKEAVAFGRGSFADPAAIHGGDMPGLAELRAGFRKIVVRYRDLPNGGEISYRTSDLKLAAAVRAWFAAQLRDHGRDATSPDPPAHDGHGS